MSTTEVDEFLKSSSGSKHPAYKFNEIGDTCKGVIVEDPRIVERPNLNDGQPEKQLVLAVTDDDGNTFALWVRRGQMAQAIDEAVTQAGAAGLALGGKIAVRFDEKRDTGKPSPLKVFKAQYQAPPAAAVSLGENDLL